MEAEMADTLTAGNTVHIIRPSCAWITACGASGLALVASFGLASFVDAGADPRTVIEFLAALLPASLFFAVFIGFYTVIPTIAAAWLMHALRWQAVWISALLGGITGAVTIQLFNLPLQHGLDGLWITALFTGVDLVGGAVYRLVAGRG
jgi:hypothetical protein